LYRLISTGPRSCTALLLAGLALLGGCAPDRAPAPGTFRDTGKQLYSNAVFEPAQLSGQWQQVAAFAAPDAGDCRAGGAEFAPSAAAVGLTTRLCLNGQAQTFSGTMAPLGPGRFALRGADPAGIGQPWWVIWVDTNYRTLVIGTPSGDFGFILNRGGPLPADRMAAARDILDWNGYDLSRLRMLAP
jgi:apolipoprotein D and lipocalin family protein